MAKWTIKIVPSAIGDIHRIPRGDAAVVTDAISALGQDPLPYGSEAINDYENGYKILAGDYTVEYELIAGERVIKVLLVSK